MNLVQIWQITHMYVCRLQSLWQLLTYLSDYRPKQSRPSLHGTTLPRPKAERGASNHQIESRSSQAGKYRLPPPHYRRCGYRTWRIDCCHEVDQVVRREGSCWCSYRGPGSW